jgi:hypothetical protein
MPNMPGMGESGGAQMARVCSGAELPRADKSKFYLLRAFGNTAGSGHEMWDVTDPARPSRINVIVGGLTGTHKSWWECDTGIAYLVSGQPGWRVPRMTKIYDLSDPTKPCSSVTSACRGTSLDRQGSRLLTTDYTVPFPPGRRANRVYFAYGYVQDGVVQIVDREKLLKGPAEPTEANLLYPQISRMDLPPNVGAHNVFPLLGMSIAEFAKEKDNRRDMLAIVDEAIGRDCATSARAMMWIADITTETKPFGVANWTVAEASGNYCGRGAGRFGTHSTNENLTPIYYKPRPVRRAFQRRRTRRRHPGSLSPEGNRVLHPGCERQNGVRGRTGRPAVRKRYPDQQRRGGRSGLCLCRRPRGHGPPYPRAHWHGAPGRQF